MTTTRQSTFHADATNDPLVGTQEHPDDPIELAREPESEAAPWPTQGRAEKSHLVAGVLGLLLGWMGAHRFYLGYKEVAVFQLMLFLVCFIPVVAYGIATGMRPQAFLLIALSTAVIVWIWGAVEGAMILNGMMPHDGHGHPLR